MAPSRRVPPSYERGNSTLAASSEVAISALRYLRYSRCSNSAQPVEAQRSNAAKRRLMASGFQVDTDSLMGGNGCTLPVGSAEPVVLSLTRRRAQAKNIHVNRW